MLGMMILNDACRKDVHGGGWKEAPTKAFVLACHAADNSASYQGIASATP
jgi:hypothetical protein